MPPAPSVSAQDIEALGRLCFGRRVVVLTGAGCSTESGIPDYRGPETRRRARNPIQFQELVRDAGARRRYWARSVVGWPRIAKAQPNPAHYALAALESLGVVTGLITQNVDGLHQRAGTRNVLELHGTLSRVRCLSCNLILERSELQARLLAANPEWQVADGEIAPDGDAELDASRVENFQIADCPNCNGMLKPDVVFFGESVSKTIVAQAFALLDAAELVLVVGSSLAVFSGYRFVRRAEQLEMPISIVNLGESRGDAKATLRLQGRAGDVLPRLTDWLAQQGPAPAMASEHAHQREPL